MPLYPLVAPQAELGKVTTLNTLNTLLSLSLALGLVESELFVASEVRNNTKLMKILATSHMLIVRRQTVTGGDNSYGFIRKYPCIESGTSTRRDVSSLGLAGG